MKLKIESLEKIKNNNNKLTIINKFDIKCLYYYQLIKIILFI